MEQKNLSGYGRHADGSYFDEVIPDLSLSFRAWLQVTVSWPTYEHLVRRMQRDPDFARQFEAVAILASMNTLTIAKWLGANYRLNGNLLTHVRNFDLSRGPLDNVP